MRGKVSRMGRRRAMNRSRALVLNAALGVALSGCMVGPDYRKPGVKSAADWHQSLPPVDTRTVQTAIDPQWWRVFRDPELTALEARLVDSNLDLRAAAMRLSESLSERRIARAAEFPHAEASASYARERASSNGVLGLLGSIERQGAGDIAGGAGGLGPVSVPGAVGNPSFNLPQYGMSASWEIDFWGHVRRQVEAATAATRETDDMRRNILVSLQAETAEDYITLRGVQAEIGIVQDDIALAQKSVHLTTMRFEQGTATRLDVADATGQLHTFESRLPALQRQQVHMVNALSFLVAREPGALTAELNTATPIPPTPATLPVGVPSDLADRRPDIRMAEEHLHVATASIGVAIADFYPRVTLSGSLDIQALQFSGLGSWASRQYGVGPTATIPLFEGGRLHGQLALRKQQQKEAAIELQRTVLKAWEEIDDAMADLSSAQAQADRLRLAVAQNRIAVETARAQYVQGSSDFLNVLTTQNALLDAQRQLIGASTQVSTSVTHLYRALGGGWEQVYPAAATPAAQVAAK